MKKIAISLLTLFAVSFFSSVQAEEQIKTIYMVVWRGCEDACQGFKSYFEDNGLPVNIIVRNADRKKSKLSGFVEEAKSLRPDLVVTWGTTVSKEVIGTINDFGEKTRLGDIPAMFMIVADPMGAGITNSEDVSGRNTVTGTRNRISDEVQIRAMREYFPVNKIGVIYSESELNSVLNTANLQTISKDMGFTVYREVYKLDEKGVPYPDQFDGLISSLAKKDVDVIYVGSSSYNLDNADQFTQAALVHKIPVASAYDMMVTNSKALISVSNKYYRVGRLAGNQAKKVIFEDKTPGELDIAQLSQFSIAINMDVAKEIGLFPPIQLIRFADLVSAKKQ